MYPEPTSIFKEGEEPFFVTSPTVGPLFGSYKVQLDIFEIPLRLYNAKLHMNKLGVGMDMSKILLPQVDIHVNNTTGRTWTYADNEQIKIKVEVER